LAGPNPYELHSFRELRAVMRRVYVVCHPCQRYVGVGAWLDDLDSRLVTFSCTVCGRLGKLAFDDPGKEGLQHDLRADASRHPEVAARLQHLKHLANPFGRGPTVVRELLPQSERTKFVPEPRYRLKPMPFSTFGDLPRAALVLEVWCSTCKSSRPVEVGMQLAPRRFGGVRFVCVNRRHDGDLCGGLGHPHIVPLQSVDANVAFASLNCPRCVPPWSASPVHFGRLPWISAPIDTATERYRCPACGGQVRATFHGRAASGARSGYHRRNEQTGSVVSSRD
jgi:hypothetical protein